MDRRTDDSITKSIICTAPETHSFGKTIVKIGPSDPGIIVLRAIIKKDNKKEETRSI